MKSRSNALKDSSRTGFSLVELSIVLVILGLLVGGVLAGQSLIKSAAIKRDLTKVEQIRQSVFTFKDKYFALPGDMPNASSFWPSAVNGSGNGRIAVADNGTSNDFTELNNFFPHLSNAQLIEGQYQALAPNLMPWAAPGLGGMQRYFPISSAFFPSFFGVYFMQSQSIWSGWLANANRQLHYIAIQGEIHWPNTSSNNRVAHIPSDEAMLIDTKYDDGQPLIGRVISWSHNYNTPNTDDCLSSNVVTTAQYVLGAGNRCDLFFEAGF